MRLFFTLLLSTVISFNASADLDGVLNRAGGFFAGINSCGEVTPQSVANLNRALPCVNYTGTDANNQAAWETTQTMVFAELARRNRSESRCRIEFFQRTQNDEDFTDNIALKMITQFDKIRKEIRRIRDSVAKNDNEFIQNSRTIAQPEAGAALAIGYRSRNAELDDQLRRLLATVPFGHEPEVAEFLIRADAELPLDFHKSVQGLARFRDSLPAVFNETSKKYYENQSYLGSKSAGEITEDDRERFGEARVLENFVSTLAIPPASKEVLYCRLDAKYQRGQAALQTAELVFTGLSFALLAGATVVSGGAASPVTVPAAIALGAVTAVGAVNQINQTIRQCYGESFLVARKANTCDPQQEVDMLSQAAQNNKCYSAVAFSALTVAGVAADVAAGLRGLKALRRAGTNTASDTASVATQTDGAASQADEAANTIIVNAPEQNYNIARITSGQRQAVTRNRRFKSVLDSVDPAERDDAVSILALIKNQNNPRLSDQQVINKFNRLVATGSCSVGGGSR